MTTKKIKALFEIFLIVTLSFFVSISFASQEANAQENVCCEKTSSEQYCQYVDESDCATGLRDPTNPNKGSYSVKPGTCDQASFCAPGCCDLNSQGQGCSSSTGRATCEHQGGSFTSGSCTSVPGCQTGCCILGTNVRHTTQQGCKDLYTTYAPTLQPNFKPGLSEPACFQERINQETGCCVTEGGCKRETRQTCDGKEGAFYNQPCSAVLPGTCDQCKGAKTTACVEGSTDIHAFDSCGNQEGISKTCNLFEGEVCGQGAATNKCDDVNCATTYDNPVVQGDGGPRKNEESWCEYQGQAGPTLDLPGTRHYRHACVNGKEIVDECTDYREGWCFEKTLHFSNDPNSPGLKSAKCIRNRYDTCTACTTAECCNNNELRDCAWISPTTETAEQLKNTQQEQCAEKDEHGNPVRQCQQGESQQGYCIPFIPPGTDKLCDTISQKDDGKYKPVVANWEKILEWGCENNCIAYTPEYAQTQNSLCQAYGDCGAHYNLAGVWSNEGFIRNCPKGDEDHNINDREDPSDVEDETVLNTLTRYGDGDEQAKRLLDECTEQLPNPNNFAQEWSIYKGLLNFGDAYPQDFGFSDQDVGQIIAGSVAGTTYLVAATISTFVAAEATLGTTLTLGLSFNALPGIGQIISVVVLVVSLIGLIIISVIGDDYPAKIATTCKPWQPPRGGQYCNLCHEEGRRADGSEIDYTAEGRYPCTEYLCQSLGTGCSHKETTDGPRCLSKLCEGRNADVARPFIRLSQRFKDQQKCLSTNEDGQAITCDTRIIETLDPSASGATIQWAKPNMEFLLEIETYDEEGKQDFARCKLSKELTDTYETTATAYAFDQDGLSSIHNLTLTHADLNPEQDTTFYIRCTDSCDNGNDAPAYQLKISTAQAPDLTPPALLTINPENNNLLSHDTTLTQITLTLNEKVIPTEANREAGCRINNTDIPYSQMTRKLSCSDPAPQTKQTCTGILTNLKEGANTYFLRCNDLKNNANKQSLIPEGYTLVRTGPLSLTSLTCNDQPCEGTFKTLTMTIEARTEGGAEQGKATCGMSTRDVSHVREADFTFEETNAAAHKTIIGPLAERISTSYNYHLLCEDKAGNVNKTRINFNIELDKTAPLIQAVYNAGEALIVETNEEATCSYINEGIFDYSTATHFSVTGATKHTTTTGGANYFLIGCEDTFKNRIDTVTVYKVN